MEWRRPRQSRCARGAAEGEREILSMSEHRAATPAPDPKHVVEFVVPPSDRPTTVRIERYDQADAGLLEDRYPGLVATNYEGDPYVILLTPGGGSATVGISPRRTADGDAG